MWTRGLNIFIRKFKEGIEEKVMTTETATVHKTQSAHYHNLESHVNLCINKYRL